MALIRANPASDAAMAGIFLSAAPSRVQPCHDLKASKARAPSCKCREPSAWRLTAGGQPTGQPFHQDRRSAVLLMRHGGLNALLQYRQWRLDDGPAICSGLPGGIGLGYVDNGPHRICRGSGRHCGKMSPWMGRATWWCPRGAFSMTFLGRFPSATLPTMNRRSTCCVRQRDSIRGMWRAGLMIQPVRTVPICHHGACRSPFPGDGANTILPMVSFSFLACHRIFAAAAGKSSSTFVPNAGRFSHRRWLWVRCGGNPAPAVFRSSHSPRPAPPSHSTATPRLPRWHTFTSRLSGVGLHVQQAGVRRTAPGFIRHKRRASSRTVRCW